MCVAWREVEPSERVLVRPDVMDDRVQERSRVDLYIASIHVYLFAVTRRGLTPLETTNHQY